MDAATFIIIYTLADGVRRIQWREFPTVTACEQHKSKALANSAGRITIVSAECQRHYSIVR